MKNIYYIFLIFTIGIFFNSCTDDLLEKNPLDEISNADFWKTEGDLQLYLNDLYGKFPGWAGGGAAPSPDLGTDIVIESSEWFGGSSTPRLDGTLNVPATGGGWNWGNVREINFFLENAARAESGDLVEHYIGEGHFFRAYFYYNLMRNFGDLPIITKVLNVEDNDILYSERSPRTEVANFILAELDLAISKMKDASELQEPSRLNKDIALQFKARVALYEGTWEKYHQGTDFAGSTNGAGFLQQAADAAKSVMDAENYSLATGNVNEAYYNLFVQTDYSGHPEVMLYKQYDYLTYNIQNSLWNQPNAHGMTREMTKYYLASDGLPIAVSPEFTGDATLAEIQENRDPRLAQSVMAPGDLDFIGINGDEVLFSVPFMTRNPTGYSIEKWRSKQLFAELNNQRTRDIGYIIFRYAESLLIYAEAKAELGTITQADVNMSINLLRDRVGMPDLDITNITVDPEWPDYGYAMPDYLYEIRRERVVELFGEGNRLDDLMRWRAHKLFVDKRPTGTTYTADIEAEFPNLVVNNDGFLDPFRDYLNTGTYGFDPTRDYLLPIPSTEITLNNKIDQNPNW
ncbi:RagB/SusD family nutrient uptake outer membrane protein [Cellulophaga sp. F20128]|uniref:RagB/SusD family nutrient uptake outer membrane protein n=1 Tax=Cellulophaga sp. F20128 TaxID=2926413 RepID=UPI001FF32D40|nr:RagB/SusD family nutrient uptake outer membrane protein [Cellulophaga sp. F20128]MCK0156462.1 RagB/SusD family nutrient uptake outer membrane protein [Cellulophaga sp. F20128]